jgi:hypothetical protein
MKNSLFTHYLLESIRGKARTRGDGLIRVFDMFDYVSEKVPTHKEQHPIFKASDLENNFPIALFLGGESEEGVESTTMVDKRALRDAILNSFNLEDLDLLCADIEQDLKENNISLSVSLEMVGGSSKTSKVLNLIEYLARRQYLGYLVAAVRRARPGII